MTETSTWYPEPSECTPYPTRLWAFGRQGDFDLCGAAIIPAVVRGKVTLTCVVLLSYQRWCRTECGLLNVFSLRRLRSGGAFCRWLLLWRVFDDLADLR